MEVGHRLLVEQRPCFRMWKNCRKHMANREFYFHSFSSPTLLRRHLSLITLRSAFDDPSDGRRPAQIPRVEAGMPNDRNDEHDIITLERCMSLLYIFCTNNVALQSVCKYQNTKNAKQMTIMTIQQSKRSSLAKNSLLPSSTKQPPESSMKHVHIDLAGKTASLYIKRFVCKPMCVSL